MLNQLGTGAIHLWLALYELIDDERLLNAYRELLSRAEREQERRFQFTSDRRRYLVTRALVRIVLSRYLPVLPKDWLFCTNAYGRPQAVNVEARQAQLSFNISHTHGLIAMGVTRYRLLGLDVENVNGPAFCSGIVDRYFAADEVLAFYRVPPEQRRDRYFEYWTFKESYIKARGMGLSIPLDKFSFDYPHQRGVRITIDPVLADHAERWQFWQFRPSTEYLMAVCIERKRFDRPEFIIRKIIPGSTEELLAPVFSRSSEEQLVFS
ncbi:4'-phosphopantetheinyl transferase family protein [Pseudomonas batumici]|uniref:BatI n=2 Tax=Pseudomonas TaxID=286 RepID=D4NZE4_PSEFL|nr:4'-phosphopantetheinyl transferase superfamily protein [Pseudomonas batumici]ADD82950.1 BatI [Pseudomonas fluorescens]KIH86015.1 BatI, batumin synthesis operon, 4'-phosphopantetheinyl transferase [Pseudomonas batumici]